MSKIPASKVVLTAFGKRLISKPMEWPTDKIGEDIYLIMDMERPSITREPNSSIKVYDTVTKKARFQFSGGYSMSNDTPAIYVLVGVEESK